MSSGGATYHASTKTGSATGCQVITRRLHGVALITVAAGRPVLPSFRLHRRGSQKGRSWLMFVACDALQRFVKLGEVRGLTEGAPVDIRDVRKHK